MNRSAHIAFATLVDWAENRVGEGEREAAAMHLDQCEVCANEMRRLENIIQVMQTDRLEDAPRHAIADAVALFRPANPAPSGLRRLVAALSFDSFTSNLAFGVRSGSIATRQLIYSAGESDIDLRISVQENQWLVSGQVLGEKCAGGRVEIEGVAGSASAQLNDLCEFTLPALAPGTYLLRVRMQDLEVEVPELKLNS